MQGIYFDKKAYDDTVLPDWNSARHLLPEPILDGEEDALAAYWRAWELAFAGMCRPTPENGFVSNYMYMEFSGDVFAHDTTFMVMFGRYGMGVFSAVETFDNFYAKQHETGEICRQISCRTGEDVWKNEHGDPMRIQVVENRSGPHYWWTRPTVDTHPASHVSMEGLNDPSAMAWGEMASFQQTGDVERLRRVIPVQRKWYEAFQVYVRDRNGLYLADWASADNHPRNPRLGYGLDVACQVAHLARLLAEMCRLTGESDEAHTYEDEAEDLCDLICEQMWDEEKGFFFDLDRDGNRMPVWSVFGLWPLLAGAATPEQAKRLAAHMEDPRTFNRPVRVPTIAATEEAYVPGGSYFRGGVFPFTNQMVITGLESFGLHEPARKIALNFWRASVEVFKQTGTMWEYLAPESVEPGYAADPANPGENARPNFAGWGALAPISYLLEYAIGLRANALRNTLTWNLTGTRTCGCRRYAFGSVLVDLSVEPRKSADEEPVVRAKTNKPFTLILKWGISREKMIDVVHCGK